MQLIWHLIGWTTFVVTALGGAGSFWWLLTMDTENRTWLRPLRVPRIADVPPPAEHRTQGFSDYVGLL